MPVNIFIMLGCLVLLFFWRRWHTATSKKYLDIEKKARLKYIEAELSEVVIRVDIMTRTSKLSIPDGAKLKQSVKEKFLELMDDEYVDDRIDEILREEARSEREENIALSEFDEGQGSPDEDQKARELNSEQGTRKPINQILNEIYRR